MKSWIVRAEHLSSLFTALLESGYKIIGPKVRDGAIVCDEISSPQDLPSGWTDEQEGGTYELKRRADQAMFGYNAGPTSWKQFLLPPALSLWSASKKNGSIELSPSMPEIPKLAFLGVRACELHAIAIQDRVMMQGPYADEYYKAQRSRLFVVAVPCAQAAATCFCASMKTGPEVIAPYDLAMTEIIDDLGHRFLVRSGSAAGDSILEHIPRTDSTPEDEQKADELVSRAGMQQRAMQTDGLKELLYRNLDHARWSETANRCLTCTNCTQVCPTCFCTTVEDLTDLKGEQVERRRKWDSCFNLNFSYIHGGPVRSSAASRYRQWLIHKLASWIDQFGSSGCVGCGRCITWCPVGIDLTEEVRAIRISDRRTKHSHEVEQS